jgi:hypothetical protein
MPHGRFRTDLDLPARRNEFALHPTQRRGVTVGSRDAGAKCYLSLDVPPCALPVKSGRGATR